jgi:CheY-like chemotaxis protein
MATILIIDDDEALRTMMKATLRRAGHHAVTAENGGDALAILEAITVDLIVTDLIMPEIDGLEFIRYLRRTDQRTPVLAVSGGSPRPPANCLAVAVVFGADETLEKPFRPSDLAAAVDRLLDGLPPAEEAEPEVSPYLRRPVRSLADVAVARRRRCRLPDREAG